MTPPGRTAGKMDEALVHELPAWSEAGTLAAECLGKDRSGAAGSRQVKYCSGRLQYSKKGGLFPSFLATSSPWVTLLSPWTSQVFL